MKILFSTGAVLLAAASLAASGCGGEDATGAADRTATLWAVGDGATGSPEARALVRDVIVPGRPDRFLYLGDVYDNGTAQEFATNYEPVYGALHEVTAPALGDHEWATRETGYRPYWERVRGRAFPNYYALREGGWDILVLNTEGGRSPVSPQARWLRERLARGGDCRIVVMHRPRYSAGDKGDQEDLEPLTALLRGRAKLLVSGDDHTMQRLEPRDGLVQLVAGSGGRELGKLDRDDPRLAFGADDRLGAVRIDLAGRAAGVEFVDANGDVLDRSTQTCSPAAGSP